VAGEYGSVRRAVFSAADDVRHASLVKTVSHLPRGRFVTANQPLSYRSYEVCMFAFGALTLLVGRQEGLGIRPVKN